ncbi:hypothetical protein EJ08DRAFT_647380 [Tothia fuscella]|uniref:F-box domain-containing protein n=1 Tax=Tothia fuscella TaxID=1048955 RepID=A0A9P4NXZ6_9PEZI|nr:hypothetical protein EJ08DRAFT_647380 [Tothia fuscella]
MGGPHLLDLPNEILDHVFSYLDPIDNRGTLIKACLVSQRFCAAAQPLLFSHFKFLGDLERISNEASYHYYQTAPKTQLVLFTRTVILRPDLAANVKILDIAVYDGEEYETYEDYVDEVEDVFPMPLDADMARYTQALRKPCYTAISSDWLDSIVQNSAVAFIALLVSQTPNLERLSIVVSNEPIFYLLELAQLASNSKEETKDNRTPLSTLKELEISFSPSANDWAKPDVDQLTLLSSLQSLHIWGYPEVDYAKSILRGSNLSTLILSHCFLGIDSAMNLIRSCKALKVFHYAIEPLLYHGTVHPVSPGMLVALLSDYHSFSLEELNLDYHAAKEEVWAEDGPYAVETLKGFISLNKITLSQDTIPPPSMWPAATRSVTITECTESIAELTASLPALKDSVLPLLETIIIYVANQNHYKVFGLEKVRHERFFFDRAVSKLMADMVKGGIVFSLKLSWNHELDYMSGRLKDGWSSVRDDQGSYDPDGGCVVLVKEDSD